MSRQTLVALIISFAFFMQNLDATVITTALPQMAISLNVNPVDLNVAITAYILSIAVFTPVSGWIADRFGASIIFQAAIATFTLGSLLCAISNGVALLVASRLLQGIGGALMVPVGRLVLLRTAPKSEWVHMLTFIMVSSQLGQTVGPVIGGLIATYTSWRWIFLINLPVGAISMVLAALFIESRPEKDRKPLDWVGFVLSGASLACIMYVIESVSQRAAGGPVVIGALAVGLCAGAAAIRHLRSHPHPLVDLGLFRIASFRVNLSGGSLFRIAWGALPFLLSLLFQLDFKMTPLASGLLTFAVAIGAIAVQVLARPAFRRFGFKSFLIVNGILSGLMIFTFELMTPSMPRTAIFALLVVWGFFQSFQFTALNIVAYADIRPRQMSNATSLTQLCQQFSAGVGVAAAALTLHVSLAWRGTDVLSTADFRTAFTAAGLLALASLLFFFGLAKDVGKEISGHGSTPQDRT